MTDISGSFVPAPPMEDHLLQNTLWPELQKLYGHGYELLALASDHAGKVVISSCKATAAEHAVLRVWDTEKWLEVSLGQTRPRGLAPEFAQPHVCSFTDMPPFYPEGDAVERASALCDSNGLLWRRQMATKWLAGPVFLPV